jgi:hypothetical protein
MQDEAAAGTDPTIDAGCYLNRGSPELQLPSRDANRPGGMGWKHRGVPNRLLILTDQSRAPSTGMPSPGAGRHRPTDLHGAAVSRSATHTASPGEAWAPAARSAHLRGLGEAWAAAARSGCAAQPPAPALAACPGASASPPCHAGGAPPFEHQSGGGASPPPPPFPSKIKVAVAPRSHAGGGGSAGCCPSALWRLVLNYGPSASNRVCLKSPKSLADALGAVGGQHAMRTQSLIGGSMDSWNHGRGDVMCVGSICPENGR